jgi:hypothetical protein
VTRDDSEQDGCVPDTAPIDLLADLTDLELDGHDDVGVVPHVRIA